MKNFVQPGHTARYFNGGTARVAGEVIVFGELIGIATTDIAANDSGAVCLEGVFLLPKVTTDAFTQGQGVYWDDAANKVTPTATGNTYIGTAWVAAAQVDTEAEIRLPGVRFTAAGPAAALITGLTDNSGGAAADGTIAAVTDVATAANAIKELATKLNEVIAAL